MSNENYLQLIESTQNTLSDYFEEAAGQPLNAIGPLQDVNIFVGSTNAGKSRLLRWIMNNKSFTLFNDKAIIDGMQAVRSSCKIFIENIKTSKIPGTSIRYLNVEGWGGQRQYPNEIQNHEALEYISTSQLALRNTINFDEDFFNNIIQSLNALVSSADKDVKIKLNAATSMPAMHCLNFSLAAIQLVVMTIEFPPLQKLVQVGFPLDNEHAPRYKERFGEISKFLLPLLTLLNGPWRGVIHQGKRIYIPVLRTAIPLKISESQYDDQVYARTIRERYKLDQSVEIFSGLELYQTVLIARANVAIVRDRLTTFCQFLSDTFFDGQGGELVSLHESLKMGHRINYSVNGIERPLHQLGDGIQALIILMYQLFMAEPFSWLFIEEPELNLHPGFQRIVIDTILNNKTVKEKNLTIFMTTHSNHLLDVSIPEYKRVSIFSLERYLIEGKENFVVRSVNNKRMHALTSLGATNSSVFMANCSIWIEGVTDRKYLRAYLNAYWKSGEIKAPRAYQEDIHYSFLEYAGSNLEHYIFAASDETVPAEDENKIRGQFIANRVFLLSDLDNGKTNKHKKWSEQTYEHFTYYVTPGKEVENMVSDKILIDLLRSGFINGIEPSTVELAKITYSEYQAVGMGQYLANKFGITSGLTEKSGTLNSYYKDKLAKEVSKYINKIVTDDKIANTAWGFLSEDAKTLIRKVHAFIEMHNIGSTTV